MIKGTSEYSGEYVEWPFTRFSFENLSPENIFLDF